MLGPGEGLLAKLQACVTKGEKIPTPKMSDGSLVVKPMPSFSDVCGRNQFPSKLTNCVESGEPFPDLSTQEFRGCVFNYLVKPHRERSKVVAPQEKCRLPEFQNTCRKSVPK